MKNFGVKNEKFGVKKFWCLKWQKNFCKKLNNGVKN